MSDHNNVPENTPASSPESSVPANDLRIVSPDAPSSPNSHSTDSHSTDLHNLRGLTPGQDVPAWVAEATRQTAGQSAPDAPQGNASSHNPYTQNPYNQAPYTQPGGVVGHPYAQPNPGAEPQPVAPYPASGMSEIGTKKLVAGLLAIFLGSFGAHKFYLSRTGPGLIMLIVNLGGWFLTGLLTLITFGFGGLIFIPLMSLVATALGIIGLIEGIVYLTRSDDDFSQTYIVGRKDWF
jgi:TM2 domain-containing membrane protein YozV